MLADLMEVMIHACKSDAGMSTMMCNGIRMQTAFLPAGKKHGQTTSTAAGLQFLVFPWDTHKLVYVVLLS